MKEDDAVGHPELKALPATYAAWRESVLGRFTDQLEQPLVPERIIALVGSSFLGTGTLVDWRMRDRDRGPIK